MFSGDVWAMPVCFERFCYRALSRPWRVGGCTPRDQSHSPNVFHCSGRCPWMTEIHYVSARITVIMLASMAWCSAGRLCLGRQRVRRCLLCARACCHGPCCPAGQRLMWSTSTRRSSWPSTRVSYGQILQFQEVCSAASIELQECVRWTRCSAFHEALRDDAKQVKHMFDMGRRCRGSRQSCRGLM